MPYDLFLIVLALQVGLVPAAAAWKKRDALLWFFLGLAWSAGWFFAPVSSGAFFGRPGYLAGQAVALLPILLLVLAPSADRRSRRTGRDGRAGRS